MKTVTDFRRQITANGDSRHEIKRHLLLRRKAVTKLDSVLKNRNITLLTKSCIVKAMVFPVVMYRYKSWIIKKSVKVIIIQSCPTLFNHMDYSPPGSSVHGILQARIWEWVAMPFSITCEMLGSMKYKMESRLPGGISVTWLKYQ